MAGITKVADIILDPSARYQTIDGFGVNINSKYWDHGALVPVLDWLTDDLGATLFRLDAYGKSNWPDPDNVIGTTALDPVRLSRIYENDDFRNAAAVCRYLNGKGVEPYITLSGIAPAWMCGKDGKTLTEFNLFAEMAASYIEWLRREQGIRFTVSGMNRGVEDVYVRLMKTNLTIEQMAIQPAAFVTAEHLDCASTACEPWRPWTSSTEGYETTIPAKSIFTLSTQPY